MLDKTTEIFTSNRPIESHDKLLITTAPSYLRAATDMVRGVSDVEDKLFAIEEISRRLDEWETYRNQDNRN